MRLCLNGATIMHSPLEHDVEIASECGFSALEIWSGKLDAYLQQHTLADLRSQLETLSITPWCINSIDDITHRTAARCEELLAEVRRIAGIARAIGAPAIVVVPGARPEGASARDSVADAVDVLRLMSDAAGDVGLAFEFLGKPGCAVPTLDMAIEIVRCVGRDNVGMVIDTFHFYAGGSRLDDISSVPLEKLFVVHLNGCEDRPRRQLTDAHRLYPGEGIIPVDEILHALKAGGFDGMASIEIFRPEYWNQESRQVARTACARTAEVLTRAGYTIDG